MRDLAAVVRTNAYTRLFNQSMTITRVDDVRCSCPSACVGLEEQPDAEDLWYCEWCLPHVDGTFHSP